jgi:RHS repeat-associated protein
MMRWDHRDRLQATSRQVVAGGTPEFTYYVYDAAGQRVRKVTERQAFANATTTRMRERIYLAGFEIYREYDGSGVAVTLERETLYVQDNARRIALIETRTVGSDGSPAQLTRYQISNHLGSSSLELDSSGQIISFEEFHPYGGTSYQAVRSQTETPRRYRFVDKERDAENALYYHGARYYVPWLGRWTSTDPVASEHSSYEYARGNPVSFLDTDGRRSATPEYLEALRRFESAETEAKAQFDALSLPAKVLDRTLGIPGHVYRQAARAGWNRQALAEAIERAQPGERIVAAPGFVEGTFIYTTVREQEMARQADVGSAMVTAPATVLYLGAPLVTSSVLFSPLVPDQTKLKILQDPLRFRDDLAMTGALVSDVAFCFAGAAEAFGANTSSARYQFGVGQLEFQHGSPLEPEFEPLTAAGVVVPEMVPALSASSPSVSAAQPTLYGPYYHSAESEAAAQGIVKSSQLWGRARTNVYGSPSPAAKALTPLGLEVRGSGSPGRTVEFYTTIPPTREAGTEAEWQITLNLNLEPVNIPAGMKLTSDLGAPTAILPIKSPRVIR